MLAACSNFLGEKSGPVDLALSRLKKLDRRKLNTRSTKTCIFETVYDYDSKREVFGSYDCDTYTLCAESLSCYDKYIGCDYDAEEVCTTLTFPVVEEEV